MLIKTRRSWDIAENQVTPEDVFLNRRKLVQRAGLIAAGSALGGLVACDDGAGQANRYADCAQFAKNGRFSTELAKKFSTDLGVGGLQDPRMAPKPTANLVNAIQRHLKKNTRLGIPALVASECLHGHMSVGATVFPQAIALGSSWNTDLVKKVAATAAREARAVGVCQALSPDLDLARDPRWGRVEETYGEDPHLVGRMGVAYVKGLQGTRAKIDREHLVATVKHFAAHGSPQGGVNSAPIATGERELRDTYL